MNQNIEPSSLLLAIAGLFLLLSGLGLYLLRNVMARTGESAWSGLPEKSKFKTLQAQRKGSIIAACLVGGAGVALLLFAAIAP
ncbi:hypothetical protein M8J71_10050 [Pseudarthrobacter sp. R1]|uniref:hypothetical protein n=1 Tax=Pseudarthrobacter sp. R1 TaxID=2944934 RepID=UPI002109561D|nr:hypothetical protein [Pseudarthrobacter sp. R1]MCQ6270822.1 hypothetical protein [Pseudarthrobacter sp. R1]